MLCTSEGRAAMNPTEEATTQKIPRAPSPRRRRLPALAAAIAVTGVGVLALTLTGDDTDAIRSERLDPVSTAATVGQRTANIPVTEVGDDRSPLSSSATATTQIPTTTAPPATTVPQRLTADSRLSLEGIGPVRIGMTLNEASTAAGVPIRLEDMPPGPECRYAVPDQASGTGAELGFMVVNGRIARIDVGIMGPDRIRTVSGIGKGNTEADVQATYPGRIRVESHPYIPNGRYLVYVPGDLGLRHLGMIFETVDGEVRTFRAGLAEEVSWTEGCS